jgi:drug/metabolite transporter (DMT)-like permease
MAKWLIASGCTLLVAVLGYGLYVSLASFKEGLTGANLSSLVLTLGIVLSIGAALAQQPRQRSLRQWLTWSGSGLVSAFLGYSLYSSALALVQQPGPTNAVTTLGMLGMLLVLGGTTVQRART